MRPVTLLPLLLLAACETEELQCEDASRFTPTVTIGEGEREFMPIGDTFRPEWGNQGGQHIWFALQTQGLAPGANGRIDGLDIELSFFQDGWESSYGASQQDWVAKGDAEGAQLTGIQYRLPYELTSITYDDDGQEVPPVGDFTAPFTAAALVTDVCGTEVEGTVSALLPE